MDVFDFHQKLSDICLFVWLDFGLLTCKVTSVGATRILDDTDDVLYSL